MSGKKPIVAIVGRPNVGKSTLFNVLARERIAIVEDTPGITRDRITAEVSWSGREFTVIDTGGIEPDSKDILLSQMREQAVMAMEMADVIIFLTDVRQGLTDQDGKVADMLRRSAAPVVLAVNKVDAYEKQQLDVYEFYNLGLGDPLPISAANRQGLGELLDAVIACFKEGAGLGEEEDLRVKVAVIGKPNVGKSSLINKILGENRLVVSDIPGTTRDAIDTDFSRNGKDYVLIDTAGLRRKNKIKEDLEHYMILRAVGAIERADVAVLLIDAKEGVSEQDAKIAGLAHNRGKAVIIAVNKWDAVPKETMTAKRTEEKIRNILSFMPYAEVVFISALTGQRVSKLFDVIDMVAENHAMRIQTGVLNEILSEATAMKQPPQDKGRSLKIYYGTQVSVKPPTFVLFVNSKKLMHFSYERYLENQIRDTFGFRGTPIRIYTREKNRMPENI
ncbi:MAG: ribosome biogenesis GTPase Der [Lachnospiraceae bacterium]|nr:ribosome biogenesis GTPase Der [Lachnospiraceae bacterium]